MRKSLTVGALFTFWDDFKGKEPFHYRYDYHKGKS